MRIEFAKAWPNKNLIRAEIAMLQYKCIANTGRGFGWLIGQSQ